MTFKTRWNWKHNTIRVFQRYRIFSFLLHIINRSLLAHYRCEKINKTVTILYHYQFIETTPENVSVQIRNLKFLNISFWVLNHTYSIIIHRNGQNMQRTKNTKVQNSHHMHILVHIRFDRFLWSSWRILVFVNRLYGSVTIPKI